MPRAHSTSHTIVKMILKIKNCFSPTVVDFWGGSGVPWAGILTVVLCESWHVGTLLLCPWLLCPMDKTVASTEKNAPAMPLRNSYFIQINSYY